MKKNFLFMILILFSMSFLVTEVTQAQAWVKNGTTSLTTPGVKIINFQGYVESEDTLTGKVINPSNYNPIIKLVKSVSRTSGTPKLLIEKFVYGIDGWTKVKTLATADSSSTESFVTDTLHYGNTKYLFIGTNTGGTDSSVFKLKVEQFLK